MNPTWLESTNQLLHFLHDTHVDARTPLLKEGDIATKLFFIRTGCVRVCFNKDGSELTTQFFWEGQAATALESFITQTPSQFSIESIEPCQMSILTKQDFDRLMLADRSFQDWFYQTALQKLFVHTNRLLTFIKDSPEQRYRHLIEQQPDLVSRIPQHYVASYLGITSVSLSRIKNRK